MGNINMHNHDIILELPSEANILALIAEILDDIVPIKGHPQLTRRH